jgi:beta-lactamase superfamily II metal-dependent hydrolase
MAVHYIDVGQGDAILIEFPRAAIMIDAGGEDSGDNRVRDHLLNYLTRFFEQRRHLENTIDTVIITHAHIDHTRFLPDIVKLFKVKTLVDGGGRIGSGIGPLNQARQLLASRKVRYVPIRDANIETFKLYRELFSDIRTADREVGIRFLSGSRDCEDLNNDSLVVVVGYRNKRFLFTGDSQAQSDRKCLDEISMLINRYEKTSLLQADVLKVSSHGSTNGTTDEWMKIISPQISIISAGRSDPEFRYPGQFHAWQFGHPRESAVRIIQGRTLGVRDPQNVKDAVIAMSTAQVQSKPMPMTRAVYCTCWDGDITVTFGEKNLLVAITR